MMKKLLLCAILVAAMAATATAQEKAKFGVRAGMNISNVSATSEGETANFNSRVGYNVGLSYQLPLVSKLYLETGLNLTSRGASFKFSDEDCDEVGNCLVESVDTKFKMLYLQVPVAISWHFDMDKVSFQPFVGAYYSFGVSGKGVDNGNETSLFKKVALDDKEPAEQRLKRSEFGLRFGVGVAFLQKYYVGLGYDMGMSNLLKSKELAKNGKFKNSNLFISLGYNF